jgi:hypothetical protein
MTGIDHPVIAVRDMAAAHAAYERLGFTIPPRGSHIEWGTGNWCIMFEHDYLELRGIVKEGYTHNLEEFLKTHGEGLMGLALGTEDANVSHDALAERGFHPQPVRGLTRNFELPEGWLQPRFSLCFLEERETAGLMSVVFCQHLTPELLRRPGWLTHRNGAHGVLSIVGEVADLDVATAVHSKLFGANAVHRDGEAVHINTGRGCIVLANPETVAARYPEGMLPKKGRPRLAAVCLETNNLADTDRYLTSRGIPSHRRGDDHLYVPATEACGVVLEFSEGDY